MIPRSFSLSIIDTKPVLISIVGNPTPFIDITVKQHFYFLLFSYVADTAVHRNLKK